MKNTFFCYCRVTIVRLNEQRQIVYSKKSEILKVSLHKGEELQIMSFDTDIEYPLIVCANILYTSPDTVEQVVEDNCSISIS